jgi:hypothetical protein
MHLYPHDLPGFAQRAKLYTDFQRLRSGDPYSSYCILRGSLACYTSRKITGTTWRLPSNLAHDVWCRCPGAWRIKGKGENVYVRFDLQKRPSGRFYGSIFNPCKDRFD